MGTRESYLPNDIVADVLAIYRAKASTTIVLIKSSQTILVSAQEELVTHICNVKSRCYSGDDNCNSTFRKKVSYYD